MTYDPLRPLRLRWEDARHSGRDVRAAAGTPRFIGQVVSGGATPNSLDRVFLVHPVRVDGPEDEGATATTIIDASRTIAVVVVGTRAPLVGEMVLVQSVGGRWVAESNGMLARTVFCSPCAIPRRNLTVSWTNYQSVSGAAQLMFDGIGQWRSECSDHLAFTLACLSGSINFSVSYFPSGGCPDGLSQSCSSTAAAPTRLTLTQQSCTPFMLTWSTTAAACPFLFSLGFTQFSITE